MAQNATFNFSSYNNISPGRIGGSEGPLVDSAESTSGSFISSITKTVESGFSSARNIVTGNNGDTNSPPSLSSNDSFGGLFSLSFSQIFNFAICMALGVLFMFMAFLFLPMIIFAPQKFVLLFTLGSLCWLNGLAMLQGYRTLAKTLIMKEKLPYTIAYLSSLLMTFYATLWVHSYILTFLFAGVQIVALGSFLISYFPGGTRVLGLAKDVVLDRIKNAFGQRGSVLPI